MRQLAPAVAVSANSRGWRIDALPLPLQALPRQHFARQGKELPLALVASLIIGGGGGIVVADVAVAPPDVVASLN